MGKSGQSSVWCATTLSEKEIVRVDTGELIGQEAMTPEECQEHLFDKPRAAERAAGS